MDYWAARRGELHSLVGRRVMRLSAREMALCEHGPDGLPVWRDPNVPFVQLCRAYLEMENGDNYTLWSCQADDDYGLILEPRREIDVPLGLTVEPDSIFRDYTLSDHRPGLVRDVRTVVDQVGCVVELHLDFDTGPMALVSGEVYEGPEGLSFRKPDDSVLLFLRPEDIARVPWLRP